GPRAADAYGRFLLRHNRGDEAKALYERALKENPGNPVAERALRDIAAKKTLPPLIGSPADGVAEALFGISASLNDARSADVAISYAAPINIPKRRPPMTRLSPARRPATVGSSVSITLAACRSSAPTIGTGRNAISARP